MTTEPDDFRLYTPRVFNSTTKPRFVRDRTSALVQHLGRAPSYPERIIIARIVAIEWDLRRYDARADNGEDLSGHALRARLAAENRLRLDLAALGLQPRAPKQPTLEQHLEKLRRQQEEAAA